MSVSEGNYVVCILFYYENLKEKITEIKINCPFFKSKISIHITLKEICYL